MKSKAPNRPVQSLGARLSALLLAVPVVLATLQSVRAANASWTGATDNTWAGTGNWSATPVPGTGDTATFNAATLNTTIDLGSGVTISNILFDTSSAAAYTIGANAAGSQTLTFGQANGGITMSSTVASNQTINANLAFATTGTYVITNSSANTLTLAGTNSASSTGTKTLTIGGPGNINVTGRILGGSGAVTLAKVGSGTMTISQSGTTNTTGNGAITVGNGTLNISGGTTIAGTGLLQAGNLANSVGILNITNNAFVTNNPNSFTGSAYVGGGQNSVGIIRVASGSMLHVGSSGNAGGDIGGGNKGSGALYNYGVVTNFAGATGGAGFFVANDNTSPYGYIWNSGTMFINARLGLGQIAGGCGVLDVSGGTVTVAGNGQATSVTLQIGNGNTGAGSVAGLNVFNGGTFSYTKGQEVLCNNGNSQYASLNVSGSGSSIKLGATGIRLGQANQASNTNTLSIYNGGVLETAWINQLNAANAFGILNLNGGTLRATAADANGLIQGNQVKAVYVHSGGSIIDNNGFGTATAPVKLVGPLLAPTADGSTTFGVTGVTLGGTTTGYIGTPVVRFSGGGGQGAAGYANFDPASGTITGVTVTSPGSGYTSAPTVTLWGGSGTTGIGAGAGAATATASIGAVSSGGLTFIGSGASSLSGGYSYVGATKVLGGTLQLSTAQTLPSPAGDLVVSNATLNVDASGGTPMPAANVVLNTGATLVFTNNASANVINATGNLQIDTNTTWKLNYGTLGGNPTAAAINVAGTITVNGTNNVINVTGSGFAIGEIPLIKYTSGSLASIGGFNLGSMPPGVNGVLTNDTVNQMVALNITFIGQTLTWYGAYSDGTLNGNWDINTSTNWNLGTLKYLEYGGNTFGDLVTFDDNLYLQQSTNVNIATTLHPSQITVNSSLPYSFTGTGSIAGSGALTMSGSGSLMLGTSNNFTGGITVSAGTLIITNDNALGTNTGTVTLNGGTLEIDGNTTGTRPISLAAASTIAVGSGSTAQLAGTVIGSGALTKSANGTLVLASSNTLAAALTVNGGSVVIATNNAVNANVVVNAGTLAVTNGTLTVAGGNPNLFLGSSGNTGTLLVSGSATFNNANANNNNFIRLGAGGTGIINNSSASSTLTIGTFGIGFGNGAANSVGALYNSGILKATNGGNAGFYIGNNDNSYGYFRNSGAANDTAVIAIGNNDSTTGNGAIGVLDQAAGTLALGNAASLQINYYANRTYSGNAGCAQLNVTGGTLSFTNAGTISVNRGGNLYSSINITGSGKITGPGAVGLELDASSAANNLSTLTLASGGTLEASFLNKAGAASIGVLNFNGGILRATAADGTALVRNNVSAYIHSGGAEIDTAGFNTTVAANLLAPVGDGSSTFGVTSLTLGGTTTGYVGAPVVNISGDGVGASAIASFDPTTGTITGITVTSPGSGYTYANVSLVGGGANTASASANLGAISGGGLTKLGNGTLTLSGSNAFTGTLLVTNGDVLVTPAQQVPLTVVVADGAKFGVSTSSTTNGATIGSLTLGSSGGTTLDFSYTVAGNPTNAALMAGAVTINGSSAVRIAGSFSIGTFPILKYSSLSGSFNSTVVAPRGVNATLFNNTSDKTIYVTVSSVGGGIVWTGTNSVATNLWDLNTTTNWISGGTPTTYIENVPPGDAVTFDDSGSGTVLLSNTASPLSVTISNSAVNYTFQGSGAVAGTTGLSKSGSGSVTMSLVNTYSGNTTISNGTFQLGVANAIPSGAGKGNVTVNGTLDLNTFSELVNNLSGSGTIDTVAGGTPTLTVSNSANTTFSGSLTNTAGSLGLTKIGNSTLTLAGTNTLGGNLNLNAGSIVLSNGSITVKSGANPNVFIGTNGFGQLELLGNSVFSSTVQNSFARLGGNGGIGIINNSSPTSVVSIGGYGLGFGQGTPNGTAILYNNGIFTNGPNLSGQVCGIWLGNNDNVYGYFRNSGTVMANGSFDIGHNDATTANGAMAVFDQISGTTTISNAAGLHISSDEGGRSYGGTTAFGGMNIQGGTFSALSAGTVNVNSDGNCYSSLNISGTGAVNLPGASGINLGVNASTLTYATLTLLGGGTLQTSFIDKPGAAAISVLNLNGGTLRASASDSTSLVRNTVTAYVHAGGVTVDSAGFTNSIAASLLAPAADGTSTFGVTSITLGGTTTGYLGAPIVQILGDGTGAAAVAQFDPASGTITNIAVTSPGSGYTYANINLIGGGTNTASASANLGAAPSGGLTKIGNGVLNLDGANTYTGPTVINGGVLGGTGTIAGALTNNATLAPGDNVIGTLTVNGDITLSAGSTNVFEVDGTTPANSSIVAGGSVNYGGRLKIVPSGSFTLGQTFTLFSGAGAANASNFASVEGSAGAGLAFSFTNGVLTVVAGGTPNTPYITGITISGSTVSINGTNGTSGQQFRVLSSTNLTLALTNWTPVYTNTFTGDAFNLTVPAVPADAQQFYRLSIP